MQRLWKYVMVDNSTTSDDLLDFKFGARVRITSFLPESNPSHHK